MKQLIECRCTQYVYKATDLCESCTVEYNQLMDKLNNETEMEMMAVFSDDRELEDDQ